MQCYEYREVGANVVMRWDREKRTKQIKLRFCAIGSLVSNLMHNS